MHVLLCTFFSFDTWRNQSYPKITYKWMKIVDKFMQIDLLWKSFKQERQYKIISLIWMDCLCLDGTYFCHCWMYWASLLTHLFWRQQDVFIYIQGLTFQRLEKIFLQFILDCFSVFSNDNYCTIHRINNFDESFRKLQTRKNCSFAWTVSLILLSILLNHIFRLQKICMTLMNKILESDYGKEFFNQNTY